MRARSVIVLTGVLASLLGVPARAAAAPAAAGCDPIDPAACLLPFPNDWYTVGDPKTGTGRRIDMTAAQTPRNTLGKAVDPAEWNRNDGFSPGSMLLAHVPGLDLARTGAAPITDIGGSLAPDAPIVVVDTATGERWPYFAELDANATDPARRALIVRPAKNFLEGHRYAVALRDLRDAAGRVIPPTAAFTRLLGPDLPAGDPLRARQAAERATLADLAARGVTTEGLYLAWDFTVASGRNLSERILKIRDDAFAKLGARTPGYLVTEVTENPADDPIAREVRGTISVPSYLNLPGGPPGSRFHYGPDGLPSQLPFNVQLAGFQCEIPRSAYSTPGRAALYGHGLLGAESEVGSGAVKALAAEHGFVFCATKWAGLSQDDVATAVLALADLSGFPALADRMQQGLLNMMWLGRAMTTGLAGDRAFRSPGGKSVIDTSLGLSYDGNSQGGIMGGALTAVSTDLRRSVLGVPGMNYSTLLNRSTDFSTYATVMNLAYPDRLDQQIGLALLQMLWDRGEADGYAQHMTSDPLPGTPPHQVLMHVAFGDHQVSPLAAEVEARTIGARIHRPATAEGRNPDTVPYWGIPALPEGPFTGSGLVIWDSGSPYQPLTNTPPSSDTRDPHSDPRKSADARRQAAIFLKTGEIVDVCAGLPCRAAGG
ncbi:hypothetical protein GCM10010468_78870 [Actinocorallia longicatena]|uniref:ATP-dependent DNA helicase RecG n=1 Tax=Actinocorallia longicatena TaxID=111803 RepID=A0ABP6QQ71_9ACTN